MLRNQYVFFIVMLVSACGPGEPALPPPEQIVCQEQLKAAKKQISELIANHQNCQKEKKSLEEKKAASDYTTVLMIVGAVLAFLMGIVVGSSAKKDSIARGSHDHEQS